MACTSWQREIESYFAGGLKPRRLRRMRVHVRGCADCQRRYDQLAALEEGLAGHAWPGSELAAPHAERLLDEIDEQIGVPTAARIRRPLGLRWAAAGALGLALVALLALLLWLRPGSGGHIEYAGTEFGVRGFNQTPLAGRRLGARLFCIDPGRVDRSAAPHYRVREIDNVEFGGGGTCPLSGVLYFAATNLLDAPRQLFLVGVTAQHEVRWYYPKPDEPGSYPVAAGALDEAIGRGIMLDVNHQPGRHRVFALFSEQPLTVAEVEAAVRASAAAGIDQLAQLPVAGATSQFAFDLAIEVQP